MNSAEHVADMAREAGFDRLTEWREGQPAPWVCTTKDLARFAALVRAQAEADAHAAIDASAAKIIRNAAQGYPGNREPRELTLVERITALDGYAADYKRWLLEAEEAAKGALASDPKGAA